MENTEEEIKKNTTEGQEDDELIKRYQPLWGVMWPLCCLMLTMDQSIWIGNYQLFG